MLSLTKRLITSASFLIVGLLTVGCSVLPASDAAQTPKPTRHSLAGGNDAAIQAARKNPAKALKESLYKFLEAKSFRSRQEGSEGGVTIRSYGEFVAPDRYYVSHHWGDNQQEIILIGGNSYLKTGDVWQKGPAEYSQYLNRISFLSREMIEQVDKVPAVRFLRTEIYQGKPAIVYKYDDRGMKGGHSWKASMKIWVTAFDGLPRKSVFEGDFGGMITSGVMTWSDFGADIKIEAPIN